MSKGKKLKKAILIIAFALFVPFILFAGNMQYMWGFRSDPSEVMSFDTTNPYIHTPALISAHRSGAGIMPEETMKAFRNCIENGSFDVDLFEFDLHITKDDVLVLLHDNELDRTSDCEEVFGETHVRPENKTYEELRRLNMGAKFVTDDGRTPYAELHGDDVPDELRILSLGEVLDYLEGSGRFRYIIEVKNDGELGRKSTDILHSTLVERGLLDRVIFGTFKKDITEYVDETYPDMTRSASIHEVAEFYFSAKFQSQSFVPKYSVLQIPFDDAKASFGFNLGTADLINYAHTHDIAVQFWTINEETDMRYLISIDADGIISDHPDIAYRVREEMKQ